MGSNCKSIIIHISTIFKIDLLICPEGRGSLPHPGFPGNIEKLLHPRIHAKNMKIMNQILFGYCFEPMLISTLVRLEIYFNSMLKILMDDRQQDITQEK